MTTLLEQITAEVHDELCDESVERQNGREALSRNSQTRRVVWVHMTSPLRDPKHIGGRVSSDDSGRPAREREAYTLSYTYEVHVFAEDEEATERLALSILSAVSRRFDKRAHTNTWTWQTELDGQTNSRCKRQPKVVLALAVDVPVVDESKQLLTIADHRLTHRLQLPTT